MGGEVGSIEVGKAADVVLLDTAKPHLTPFTHPIHQIVTSPRAPMWTP